MILLGFDTKWHRTSPHKGLVARKMQDSNDVMDCHGKRIPFQKTPSIAQRCTAAFWRKMDYTDVATTVFTPIEYGCVPQHGQRWTAHPSGPSVPIAYDHPRSSEMIWDDLRWAIQRRTQRKPSDRTRSRQGVIPRVYRKHPKAISSISTSFNHVQPQSRAIVVPNICPH